jgi:hypothetical protein
LSLGLCGSKEVVGVKVQKAILKHVKWPKGTPTGDALREWLQSFEPKAKPEPEKPTPEDNPTANTKMIT